MKKVNISTAKSHLSSLLKGVVENDNEVLIDKAGVPIAKIVKYKKTKGITRINTFKDKIFISSDFDEWPDDIAKSLGVI
jgi:prevent-host-death family protein